MSNRDVEDNPHPHLLREDKHTFHPFKKPSPSFHVLFGRGHDALHGTNEFWTFWTFWTASHTSRAQRSLFIASVLH